MQTLFLSEKPTCTVWGNHKNINLKKWVRTWRNMSPSRRECSKMPNSRLLYASWLCMWDSIPFSSLSLCITTGKRGTRDRRGSGSDIIHVQLFVRQIYWTLLIIIRKSINICLVKFNSRHAGRKFRPRICVCLQLIHNTCSSSWSSSQNKLPPMSNGQRNKI